MAREHPSYANAISQYVAIPDAKTIKHAPKPYKTLDEVLPACAALIEEGEPSALVAKVVALTRVAHVHDGNIQYGYRSFGGDGEGLPYCALLHRYSEADHGWFGRNYYYSVKAPTPDDLISKIGSEVKRFEGDTITTVLYGQFAKLESGGE